LIEEETSVGIIVKRMMTKSSIAQLQSTLVRSNFADMRFPLKLLLLLLLLLH